ncbi:hypothetical protein DAPPUDRAFT_330752 [Daphnia pulex]|uniref:Tudor domain-containing protein n=1 Tax=Daphnia pulex TaxID=6669 RepID=E9HKI7_DAPPU|nr:hypothetical protein DAPPUDRAFT_330752 [Daphnia pulex]|eukprot:EFX67727.1 hypothetical protein DAPPUDRAFT_330752 [Daphnia pulex]
MHEAENGRENVQVNSVIAVAYEDGKWYLANVVEKNNAAFEFKVHFYKPSGEDSRTTGFKLSKADDTAVVPIKKCYTNNEIIYENSRNPTTGELGTRPTLLTYFAKLHVYIEQNTYPNWNLDQPNFIEFCRHFTVVKGNLRTNPNPDKTIVLTFPVH